MSTDNSFTFAPLVALTLRADGRYDVSFDWEDSCVDDEDMNAKVARACRSLDAWVATQSKDFVIDGQEASE